MADEVEEDRARNRYIGPRCLSFFEDLVAETQSIINDGLIEVMAIENIRRDHVHAHIVYYTQNVDDELAFAFIEIVCLFQANTEPQLNVYHTMNDAYHLSFPLNNEFIQQNLRPCFRVWFGQATTYPLGWRDIRFNAYIQREMQMHAMTRRALQRGQLPEEIIYHILHMGLL
jgi:hypothetical protein